MSQIGKQVDKHAYIDTHTHTNTHPFASVMHDVLVLPADESREGIEGQHAQGEVRVMGQEPHHHCILYCSVQSCDKK